MKAAIADYFDPWDLIEFLGVKTREVIDAFEEEIEEAIEAILEEMGFDNGY